MAGASRRERGFALLIGAAALILQLLLSPLHASFLHASSYSAQSATRLGALAELAALTGEQNVLCGDATGGQPGDPAHDNADCLGLCCQLGHGLALFLPPPVFSAAVPSRIAITLVAQRTISLAASTHAPNAQPRGPPPSA